MKAFKYIKYYFNNLIFRIKKKFKKHWSFDDVLKIPLHPRLEESCKAIDEAVKPLKNELNESDN